MFTEERARWLYRHFLWLELHLPPNQDRRPSPLILPTPQFFPQRNTRDHVFAEAIFATTRGFMGMAEWPCRLVSQSDEEREAAEAFARGSATAEMRYSGAAGTFSPTRPRCCTIRSGSWPPSRTNFATISWRR
jgi:hypothetical protein